MANLEITAAFRAHMKSFREEKGLSQIAANEKSGLTSWAPFENGGRKTASANGLKKIVAFMRAEGYSKIAEMSIQDGEKDPPSPELKALRQDLFELKEATSTSWKQIADNLGVGFSLLNTLLYSNRGTAATAKVRAALDKFKRSNQSAIDDLVKDIPRVTEAVQPSMRRRTVHIMGTETLDLRQEYSEIRTVPHLDMPSEQELDIRELRLIDRLRTYSHSSKESVLKGAEVAPSNFNGVRQQPS